MGFAIDNLARLFIGLQGESNARQIDIDMSEWMRDWPDAKVDVLVQRPGEDNTYPVKTELRGGHLLWTPKREDVLIAGMGKTQIVLTDKNDVELRSRVVQTIIGESIAGTEGDAPDPTQGWVQEVLQAANEVRTAVDAGEGTLYLIQQKGSTTDRTYDEINAAINAKKTCILTDTKGRVHLFSNYSASGKIVFRAIEYGVPIGGGTYTAMTEREISIDKDGKVEGIVISPINAPNPKALTIEQNGQTVTYDGKKAVNIKIAGGNGGGSIPDPGKAFQQLVSDADGKAVWQEQIAYKHVKSEMVELFAGTLAGDAEEPGTFSTTTPLDAIPEVGKTYEVTINGTKHNTAARPFEMNGVVWAVLFGNAGIINPDDYDDNGETYVLIVPLPEHQAMVGGASVICIADTEAASVTLSIRGESTVTTIKKIDKDLLPDTGKTITIMIDADGNVMTDTPFAEASKMTCGELQSALKIVQTGSYGGKPSTLEADVQVRRRITDMLGETLEITFRQYTDPGDADEMKETTRYIYWAAGGLQLAKWALYSLPIMDAWGSDQQTYYIRSVRGVWQPVTIEQMRQDLGIGGGAEPATTDVFYTADGQVFTDLNGAVMHVQKGEA